jgi:hypothetical protein
LTAAIDFDVLRAMRIANVGGVSIAHALPTGERQKAPRGRVLAV